MRKGVVDDRAFSTPAGTTSATRPTPHNWSSTHAFIHIIFPHQTELNAPPLSVLGRGLCWNYFWPLSISPPCHPGVNVNLTFDEGLSAIFSERGTSELIWFQVWQHPCLLEIKVLINVSILFLQVSVERQVFFMCDQMSSSKCVSLVWASD